MWFCTDQLSIIVGPSDTVYSEGETAQFTATAKGVRKINFIYEWKKRGRNRLPNKVTGINGPVLTVPNLVNSDEGSYYCTVTNEWNSSVKSNDVVLAVEGTYLCTKLALSLAY